MPSVGPKSVLVRLKCEVCNFVGYVTAKRKATRDKLELKKYCKKCKKHTLHKETKVK